MKLNDAYYYCFGCGANGDAIALPPPKRGLTDEQWADIALLPAGADRLS
jgi:hypothetical protein